MADQSIPPEPKALTSTPFIEAIKLRRTIYSLKPESTIPDSKIVQIVNETILHVPSAFNTQTTRIAVVVKEAHKKFWDIVAEQFKAAVGEEGYKKMEGKLLGFRNAYGSVLFFEDTATIKQWQGNMPQYAPLFPPWSEHTDAMHQFVLWTAREAEGMGANLQHFQFIPAIESKAKEAFGLPEAWEMKAQLVFGTVTEGGRPTEAKEKMKTEEAVKVFGVEK